MPANQDFRELFCAFNAASVRYLVVGAYAVIHYSEPRYTKDLDIWVEPTAENAQRVWQALVTFGVPTDGLVPSDLANPDLIYQLGIEPNRIDLVMSVTGLEFASAWSRSVATIYDGVPIKLLSLADLIAAKRACGRPQDLLDIALLEQRRDSDLEPSA
jgi:hypothetical protein